MAVPLSLLVKNPLRNARVVALTAVLLVGAAVLLLREQRVSFLRPGLQLNAYVSTCLLYTSPSPRDLSTSRMPSSA